MGQSEEVEVSCHLVCIQSAVGPQALGVVTPPEVPPVLGRAGESMALRPARSKSHRRSWEAAGLAWVST